MPGKESSGKEEKKQFFRYGLLLYGIMFSSSVSCFFCLFYPAKALHLHYFAPIYRTGNSQAILRALLPYGYIFFLFYPLFFTHNLLKIQGFWAVLLPCSYLLFILSFLPSSTRLFLENTGFLAVYIKRRRGKGGWEADLLAWDFCGYFLLLFLIFYPLKTLFFGIFEKRDGKKRGKQGVFCWRFKHGNGEEKRGEREKKQEDFGWVFIWIYRELSKNYFL